MDRRTFIAIAAGAALAAPWRSDAQVTGKVYRIGYLGQGSKAQDLAGGGPFSTLLKNLRPLGYVEGTNLTVESHFADGRTEVLRLAPGNWWEANRT